MTCTLGGLIQYHVQFMCSIIACLMYDQANSGGAIAPPAPMVPTPMQCHVHTIPFCTSVLTIIMKIQ